MSSTSSLGFGAKPFGFGPYGGPLAPPAPSVVSPLSSSRAIDGATGAYIVNEEGGFEAMDDTAQRVLLLVDFALTRPEFLTQRDLAQQAAAIRKALTPLTSGPEPAIRLLAVAASERSTTRGAVRITYINLLTGTEQTVEPAPA